MDKLTEPVNDPAGAKSDLNGGLGIKIINHKEAFELACYKREHSNLARSYLELHSILNTVWHCMNDDNPPDFPMREIEEIVTHNAKVSGGL